MTQGIRKKEDEFKFNKDAGLFVCPAEHIAKRKSKNQIYIQEQVQECLLFDVEKCKVCPLQEFLRRGKSKTYSVAIKSEEHLDQQAFQETEEFKRLTRERYKIEEK